MAARKGAVPTEGNHISDWRLLGVRDGTIGSILSIKICFTARA